MKFLNFFLLLWVIFALLNPDPDSENGSGSTDLIESGSGTLNFSITLLMTGAQLFWRISLWAELLRENPRSWFCFCVSACPCAIHSCPSKFWGGMFFVNWILGNKLITAYLNSFKKILYYYSNLQLPDQRWNSWSAFFVEVSGRNLESE